MSSSFDSALKFVLQWEGGYVNHPADPGGETNLGVTKATYNSYRTSKKLPLQSVRSISMLEVKDIYYANYWLAAGCNLMPPKLALCHFDWAVNHGVTGANKTLQRVINTEPDGILGPLSRAALASNLNSRGERSLISNYCIVRENCYRRWGTGRQAVFLNGWLNRLAAVRKACY